MDESLNQTERLHLSPYFTERDLCLRNVLDNVDMEWNMSEEEISHIFEENEFSSPQEVENKIDSKRKIW